MENTPKNIFSRAIYLQKFVDGFLRVIYTQAYTEVDTRKKQEKLSEKIAQMPVENRIIIMRTIAEHTDRAGKLSTDIQAGKELSEPDEDFMLRVSELIQV